MPVTPENPLDRLIDAMLARLAAQGWRAVTVADVAADAGIAPDAAYALCPDRAALVDAFARRLDVAACADAGVPPEDAEGRRDLLLDVMLRRFEGLSRHRPAAERLIEGLSRDPETLMRILPQSQRSFGYLARAAGFPSDGLRGILYSKALAAAWLATQRTWRRDETPDLAATMAALDRNLQRFVWPLEGAGPFKFGATRSEESTA
jgi:AcrR family transcriptional regulator